jgi:hypothetical protein
MTWPPYVIPAGTSTRTNMADQTTLSPGDYTRLATEAETNLRAHVLAKWYPAAVDRERGGFHQNFAEDWSRAPGDERGYRLPVPADLARFSGRAPLPRPGAFLRRLRAARA